MKKRFFRLLIPVLILLVYVIYKFGLSGYLGLENIKLYSLSLKGFVDNNYILSVMLYMLAYYLCISLSIPAVVPMSVVGGYLFGTFLGVFYSTLAAVSGAATSFLIFRYAFYDSVVKKYGHIVKKYESGIKRYGVFYIMILNFMMILPFFIINIIAVIAGLSFYSFLTATLLGFIPSGLLYSFAGSQLHTIKSINDVFSFKVIIALGGLIILSLLPILIRRFKRK